MNSEPLIPEKGGNTHRNISAYRRELNIIKISTIATLTTIFACLSQPSLRPPKYMNMPDKTSRGGSIRKLMDLTSKLAEAPEYKAAV
ncbi:MAG: hypothetical protein WCY97_01020 [Methanothrix sp.]|nr:hypothetical protein [Methanothrix harundinacea]MDD2639231.1 hypothetical protein [Methanothrix sp.]MDD3710202.1 hypothetical protein [Methanothrix sp.]MDD5768838.1 hypothetical protein [Methanothrix sp.]MDI9398138.1 hypothetical protein [Euryarchaeota archaeon]